MDNSWSLVLDFAWLSLFIGLASIVKARIKVLRNFIIPTSIIAGFLGLLLGPELLNLVQFNAQRFGNLVYHLMAIGFIALALKKRQQKKTAEALNSGMFIVSVYLVQGILALGITLFLAFTVYPDLFPPFGLLLPLGYGQGPGQAFSIGSQWEQLGFIGGGNIGLTIATFGFLWATLVGVSLMNYLIRSGRIPKRTNKMHKLRHKVKEEMEPDEIPLSESLDKLSVQLFMIGMVYLVTYFTLTVSSSILTPLGTFGQTLAQLLWGFHFIIGTVYAFALRSILNYLEQHNVVAYSKPNNYLLQRLAGGCFDFMITASIAAISIYALRANAVTILAITTLGGMVTIFYTIFMCRHLFPANPLESILGFYGMLTGTISTGMALLKEVDPNFDTDVSENLVLGSATGLLFGFPLLLILNVPIVGYVTGQPIMYLYTMLLLIAYLGVLQLFLQRNIRKKLLAEGATAQSAYENLQVGGSSQ